MMRATEAYDMASKDSIISEYANRFFRYYQCDPLVIKQSIHGIAESLALRCSSSQS